MRDSTTARNKQQSLVTVNTKNLDAETRAIVEAEIVRHDAERAERRRIKAALKEAKHMRSGGAQRRVLPKDGKPQGDPAQLDDGTEYSPPLSPGAPSPMPTETETVVPPSGPAPQGAGRFVPVKREAAMERGPEVPKRADGKGSIVAGHPATLDDGTPYKPARIAMGYSNAGAKVVALDPDGNEVSKP